MFNWKRKRIWIGLPILLLITVAVAVNLISGGGLERAKAQWRAEGLPANKEELDQWYRAVPADQNAALFVLDAMNLHVLAAGTNDPNTIVLGPPGTKLSGDQREIISQYLAQNRAALAKLYEALAFPESRYPVQLWQGMNMRIDHLAGIKSLAQLLRWEAIDHAVNGRRAEAVRSLQAGFGLARTLRDEPILISELVRIALVAINLTALERVLNADQLSSSEMDTLMASLVMAEEDGQRAMYRALIGERTNISPLFDSDFSTVNALGGGGAPPVQQQLLGGTALMLYKISGLQSRDVRVYLETMADFINATTNDFPDFMRLANLAETNYQQRVSTGFGKAAILSRMLLPALLKASSKEGVIAARLRCARAALRVESHRGKTGALPENSLELDFPGDPFTGGELVFERLEQGYTIYSPGATEVAATKMNPRVGLVVAR